MRGNRNQVVLLTQDLEHLIANMQAKQTGSLDEEAHFVFPVGMLVEKLFPQRLFLRIIRAQADHVPALIAFLCHQLINRMLIGGNNRFCGWRRA